MEQSYQNWQVNITNNIVWLYFNRAERSVNTFNHVVLNELQIILTCVTQQHDIKGLVITSAKSKGFIAGADIEEFGKLKTQQEALNFIKKGQTVFAQLAALPIPTIALINGFCMGGGLELALACQYRVATDDAKTRLGLPEVLLGLHPGWGGTVRLPRLVGATRAMVMILTGRTVSAQTAEKMGLVDIVVPGTGSWASTSAHLWWPGMDSTPKAAHCCCELPTSRGNHRWSAVFRSTAAMTRAASTEQTLTSAAR